MRAAPRLRAVTGAVLALWVLSVVLDRLLLISDGATFLRWRSAFDGVGTRTVLAAVAVAALWHTLDGVTDLVGTRPGRRARVVPFLTAALGVPLGLWILWPALGGLR